nr:MAG TPA: hypothetical protein [Bacteriophage sp.]
MTRGDTIRMFSEYAKVPPEAIRPICEKAPQLMDGLINSVVDGIQQEIISKAYVVKPIRYRQQVDKCNGKVRTIGIQDIKQQLYDYIAVYAMDELFRKKLCFYQCGALKNKGNEFGAAAIKKWIDNLNMRWAWQSDVRHYYETISKRKLKRLLKRDIDNPDILHLVFFLIDTFEGGLSIGSYLSQYLANYYLSYAYHYASEKIMKVRKHRNRTAETTNTVAHVLFQMDDILIIARSQKNLKAAVREFCKYVNEFLGLEIKDTAKFIDLSTEYIDILGRKISRKSLTVRSSNFIRFRRTAKKVRIKVCRKESIPLSLARSYIGRYGAIKHSDTKRFQKKYHVLEDLKRCKEIVSTHERRKNNYGKDEIYAATVKCSILSA